MRKIGNTKGRDLIGAEYYNGTVRNRNRRETWHARHWEANYYLNPKQMQREYMGCIEGEGKNCRAGKS